MPRFPESTRASDGRRRLAARINVRRVNAHSADVNRLIADNRALVPEALAQRLDQRLAEFLSFREKPSRAPRQTRRFRLFSRRLGRFSLMYFAPVVFAISKCFRKWREVRECASSRMKSQLGRGRSRRAFVVVAETTPVSRKIRSCL